ncbi:hypothetical protein FIV42_14615 [Persicimonas caeni]|uniref:Cadherin domain-containing protein n=1 Tax=Persicimonas caeni TaxID=2292766 RepID=A0A4Y6PVA5_PERCE|nr:Calx-beta domain-containing protein [Persicimonas caeni]QDG51927.1 hypothetical protein FIV42_14615 [Persicimonas caeni]QED33148.1 hypothetical protein FRD00_14610 [Persicimonas caeni]
MALAQAAAFGAACSDDGTGGTGVNNGTLEPGTELVTLGEVSGTTSEMGGQASFDVVLAVQPTADVVISLASNDPEEGQADVSSLTFTPENWDAPQTVTVTGQDDDVADGDQTYAIVVESLETDDSRFDIFEKVEIELTNVDDETAGFTVTDPDGDTTEAGGQASFTVVLNSQPTADVTLELASSNPEEGTIDKSTLTFTADNWNAPQTVTATGQDDDVADGNQLYEVVFGETTSDDEEYAAIAPDAVELTNVDDETAGFTVSDPTGDTTEAGEQASFTVVLNSQPTADVTLTLGSSDPDEGTVDVSSLTFTPDNWNAPQTVTATGQDDDVADGNQLYEVVFSETISDDADYAAIVPDSVELTNVDDETPGISVNQVSSSTSEAGGQATFTVVLNSKPFDDVTVNFDTSDAGEGTVDQTSLTFTDQNWNAPQTVTLTGQDDDYADGDQPYNVVFSATTSNDAAYAAITPQNVAVTNTDDDSAGITVSPISGNTTEAGGQATFTVVLNSEPFDDVTVNFGSYNTREGTVGQSSLTFTDQNWNAPQTVTVTGQDDDVADGDQPYVIAFAATTSTDAAYAAITPQSVAVTNTDDDSAGITVSPISGNTSESGGQATFTVVLNSEPFDDVTVSFDSSDTGEGTVGQSSLTFTDQNWNAPQTVTLTGQNDDYADGDQPYNVVFSATTSNDAAYAAITPQNVAVTNTDDDSAGISVTVVDASSDEAGALAEFMVVLNSRPFDDVTVNFDSSDTSEGIVSRTSLTFTDQNWNAPQTVTVAGQDDNLDDGDQPYNVVFSATTSNDAAYAAITPQNVALTNTDDDSAGVTVSISAATSTEDGGAATFSVVLNSEPFDDVTFNFATSDATEGVPTANSLTFTSANWNAPQNIVVQGQDDDLADGDQPYAITFGATTSNDAAYAAISPQNVSLTNTDNDTAGIEVSAISGDTTEAGGQATFTVVLRSQPFDDVTVNFGSTDPGEGQVGTSSLTFTDANWSTPQVVTVTGQDDFVADGAQPYAITFSATTSSDAAYAAITPANVSVTNTDDDTAGISVTPLTGNTSEAGGQATFDVVLNSEPTGDVTLTYAVSDSSEGSVSPASLTFTPANWNTPQTIQVTGVDDNLSDGNQSYTLDFNASSSTDGNYDGLVPAQRSLSNVDNEVAVGTTGTTGRISGAEWIVCRADSSTAWVAANSGGVYNPTVACQSLGYSGADAWGGTCGTVCGYCGQQGNEYYDGGGGDATYLTFTVHWRCTQ